MLMPFVFGSHELLKDLERRSGFIARSTLPVLIEGPSGTGKETLAELLHDLSGVEGGFTRILCRKSGPVAYPAQSMANRTVDLSNIYSEARGTLFLKNVHLLSATDQEQLLTAFEQMAEAQEGVNHRIGVPRLISSTAESVEPLVSRGELNPGLYHRLSVYRICRPGLVERRDDIPELFAHMLRCAVNGGSAPPPPTDRLLDALMAYHWPGNLRELQNIARAYAAMGQADEIIAELNSRSRQTMPVSPRLQDRRSLKEQVKGASQKLESEIILQTLERHHWNRKRAAQTLQISYRSLLYKMKACKLRSQPHAASEGR
jgi:DNA-binding NtrC family response regulator